jgi:hypothetical protein
LLQVLSPILESTTKNPNSTWYQKAP